MNKKAQEEIIGFVLVIVLIVIIGLVFLGISLRNKPIDLRESGIIYQFLDSSMEQTTTCNIGVGRAFLKLDELLSECFNSNTECVNGNRTCSVMNQTINNLLTGSWNVGDDFKVKGYDFNSKYEANSSGIETTENILEINSGNCNGTIIGNSYLAPEFPGKIITTLKVCY